VKLRLPAVCELFWGMLGRGDGGWKCIGVSGSGYKEVLALEMWFDCVEMWFDCVERKRCAKLSLSTTAHRAFAAAPSFQAYLRALICTCCMCVCIHVYVCMCADVYTCIYMHVCMYLYIYAFIHMCMCMWMHICA